MSYSGAFAGFYDQLTEEIDYQQRARYFDEIIRQHVAVTGETILLDLACGTGSLSVALSGLGYDVIGVDGSADMLSEAVSKGSAGRQILYLCQPFERLDLFGTIDVAVCALDSINHMTDLATVEKTFEKVSLFTVPGGLFVFDVNTEYKHRQVLGDNTFVYDLDDVYCVWQNTTDETLLTEITLDFFVRRGKTYTRESENFCERAYTHEQLCGVLGKTGYELLAVYEGDTFEPVGETAQRAVYVARKK
ncbi:class I SAM-dependent methyltransferase [Oscillospiraceae bacterium PP1C4]